MAYKFVPASHRPTPEAAEIFRQCREGEIPLDEADIALRALRTSGGVIFEMPPIVSPGASDAETPHDITTTLE